MFFNDLFCLIYHLFLEDKFAYYEIKILILTNYCH